MSPTTREDAYGLEITCAAPETLAAWNRALDLYFRFRGDPVGTVAAATDETFIRGPVFSGAMKLLGGQPAREPSVARDLEQARARHGNATAIECQHLQALETLAVGDFTRAADIWDEILETAPNDMLALKASHETYFYAGNLAGMRRSATRALARWSPDQPGYGVALGQYAFALEETGDYAAAESHARLGLDLDAEDCWSLHCLAHVYEMQNRHSEALGLLRSTQPVWYKQTLLSAHIWWHLSLRLVEAERFAEALEIFDQTLGAVDADNPFRLTDGTSLLWRLELMGCAVGDRWRALTEKWVQHGETHSNGFLDFHAAMAFAAGPDPAKGAAFWRSLTTAHDDGGSENAETFRTVVKPLASAVRAFRQDDPSRAADGFAQVEADLQRIGGSLAQRELVDRSHASALCAAGRYDEARRLLDTRLSRWPNRSWLLRGMAVLSEVEGREQEAAALRRRADLGLQSWASPP